MAPGFFQRLFGKSERAWRFNLRRSADASRINAIIDGYSKVQGWPSGPHKDCVYRPASDLPFPKEEIRAALEALLQVAQGQATPCRDLMGYFASDEAAEVIGSNLADLDSYVDIPADQLPTDPRQNGVYVVALQNGRDPEEAVALHRRTAEHLKADTEDA